LDFHHHNKHKQDGLVVGFLKKEMLSEIALRLPKLNIAGYSIGEK